MELNINLRINFVFNHKVETTEQPKKQNVATVGTPMMPYTNVHRKILKNVDSRSLRIIQEKVTELTQKTSGLTRASLLAKASKLTGIPIVSNVVMSKIVFPENYKYAKKSIRRCTPAEHKDIAALIVGGVTINVISIIFETCSSITRSASVKKCMAATKPADVERVREKYKDILVMYGEYDRIAYDKHNYKCKKFDCQNTPFDVVPKYKSVFSPEQIKLLVETYESLPVSRASSFNRDIHTVARLCDINASDRAIRRALFAHEHISGCENIRTPEVKNYEPTDHSEHESLIQEVRYLRDVKKRSKAQISRILGLKYGLVKDAYDAYIRPDIKVSPEMRQIFDERYATMK